jgi:hypothetical protein
MRAHLADGQRRQQHGHPALPDGVGAGHPERRQRQDDRQHQPTPVFQHAVAQVARVAGTLFVALFFDVIIHVNAPR